jgi:hypothetical protein
MCILTGVKHENDIFVGRQLVDGATRLLGLRDLAFCDLSNCIAWLERPATGQVGSGECNMV